MTKKVIFFTAGEVPTEAEAAAIARLNAMSAPGYNVAVRNGGQNAEYGDGRLESCDFVAGTLPTAYSDAVAAQTIANFGDITANRPTALQILPASGAITGTGTKQLQVLKITGNDVSALSIADVTASSTTYSSSNTAKATVDGAGLVTGVAAGTTVITATHTFDTGKTITATKTITVS